MSRNSPQRRRSNWDESDITTNGHSENNTTTTTTTTTTVINKELSLTADKNEISLKSLSINNSNSE